MSPEFGERVSDTAGSTCYRHPDRTSYVLCQRCGNTICGSCQTPAPVGVLCPDCTSAAQSATPSVAQRWGRATATGAPIVTYIIMAVSVVVWVFQWLSGMLFGAGQVDPVTQALWYAPFHSLPGVFEPWRMLTSVFTHSPSVIFHILLNMYTLWVFGRELEHFLGRGRYLSLYLISGFAGSLFVMMWGYVEPASVLVPVVGASGAIFGLLGAFIIIGKQMGGNMTSLLILLAINLAIGFLPGASISWQAHVGGLIGGLVTALIFMRTRQPRQKNAQIGLTVAWASLLVLLSFSYFVVSPLGLMG